MPSDSCERPHRRGRRTRAAVWRRSRPSSCRVGGRPMLERSVTLLLAHPAIDEVVVALPLSCWPTRRRYLRVAAKPLRFVAGGDRRQDSVANAFAGDQRRADIIVIHDAARPFVRRDLISRTIAAAAESGAAVAATGVARYRQAVGPPATPRWHSFEETLPRDRSSLRRRRRRFTRAGLAGRAWRWSNTARSHRRGALAERAGHPVRVVEGELRTSKSRRRPICRSLKPSRGGEVPIPREPDRRGHRLRSSPARRGPPAVLGGVTIPFDRGLLGHSDADVVCHAVTDACSAPPCRRHRPAFSRHRSGGKTRRAWICCGERSGIVRDQRL